ncbi:MAG TPA: hypothetical protein VF707_17575 [Ardenticatenaceae bacterium]|jgi:hypothetical protein
MDFLDQPLEPNPVIEFYKRDLDLTLIRENLKLTPEQRLVKLMELQRFAQELRVAGERARHEHE